MPEKLKDETIEKIIGKISQIIGAVVNVEFPEGELPSISVEAEALRV